MQDARQGTIKYFELGGHRFESPRAIFSTTKVGALQNDWLVGNIGQVFLDPFVIYFDYANSRIAFDPKK